MNRLFALFLVSGAVATQTDVGAIVIGGPVGPNGVEVQVDLPIELRKVNIASKGLGCCVFRSLDHAARQQNVPALWGMPEWMVSKGIEGGGYPEKVNKLIPMIAKDRGMDVPLFLNDTGGNLDILKALLKTGRMPCITYCGRDQHYNGKTIAHMVNLVYLDDNVAAILDNNWIGENELVWLSVKEFKERYLGARGGWVSALLAPGAPPPPFIGR